MDPTLIKKFFFTLALIGYLSISVFSFVHIAKMAEMNMPMDNCPFAVGEHALCQMSPLEHIQAWQNFSTTLPPLIKVFFQTSIIFILFLITYYSLAIIRFLLYIKRDELHNYSLYQSLFSQGILNPKAP